MSDLPAYDPAKEYKTAKPLRLGGVPLLADVPVAETADKRLSAENRHVVLKALYDRGDLVPLTDDDKTPKRLDGSTAPGALTDDQKARIAELVKTNDRPALNKLAAKVENAAALPSKDAVAEAIVRAETPAA